MRFINNTFNKPKRYIKTSQIELTKLKNLTTIQERKEYLDAPANKKWNEIKRHFERIGNNKCWFTESYAAISDFYVEHFRPKKMVHLIRNKHDYPEARITTDTAGYWWLSYEYSNLRLAGAKPNQKKGNYFPLLSTSRIALNENFTISIEHPILLDPCRKEDVELLSFDGTIAIPSQNDTSNIDFTRAQISILIYDLNSAKLKRARARVYEEMKNYFEQAQLNYNSLTSEGSGKEVKALARENFVSNTSNLVSMLKPTKQFTAMVEAFLRIQNLDWVNTYVIQEAKSQKYI
ncbi:hypothetical protein [Zobellia uliginosa]|uniref:hypothetical protein n=1 Tax=Zobellia uliginosa TaxID=143224 RepID=UPI0026E24512|nr:hypothetical protein [Zobellia uliginosa]MDO6516106.1 hypothetical protein [Zobellia uliginosa]